MNKDQVLNHPQSKLTGIFGQTLVHESVKELVILRIGLLQV